MSSKFKRDDGHIVDEVELLQLGRMCKELRREKDILREALLKEKSKNAELMQRLESSANAASVASLKDQKYIEELENELKNCSQERGYLQEQLNLRNVESNCIGEQVHSLELKLADFGSLHEKLSLLSEELEESNSRQLLLMRDVVVKEEELHNYASHIEELESAISSISLESQCEIESMRLDIAALEKKCFEAERFSQEVAQQKARADVLLVEFESQYQQSQERVFCLERENKELKGKLVANKEIARCSCSKFAEYFKNWLKHNSGRHMPTSVSSIQDFLVGLRQEFPLSKGICNCDEVLCPFVSKHAVVTALGDSMGEMEKMPNKINEFELQVAQLKEELKQEKLKAKEEAEDLTQAMAELRYQITDMLEEECKRRASIEHTSLRRIQDLEEEVQKEQKKSSAAIQHAKEANQLAEMRAVKVRHLKNVLKGFRSIAENVAGDVTESCRCRSCEKLQQLSHVLTEALEDDEALNLSCEVDLMKQV